jgi:hypothetical protein
MIGQVGGSLGAIATLALGAIGAIAAIFLKEAVQAAVQRRVIAWQLFGYLIWWRSQIVKNAYALQIYEKVKQRTHALTTAATESTTEFERVHLQQHEERNELREKIKSALIKSIDDADFEKMRDSFHLLFFSEAAVSLSEQRKLLADSKSFISDRDAALLGKGMAMNVVQFRTSLFHLLSSLEVLPKLLPHVSEKSRDAIIAVVDQMILYGEEMLVAMVRLEQGVERISQQSIYDITLSVLRGN